MEFYPINLVYFIIIIPIVAIFYVIIINLKKKENYSLNIVILSMLLFIVRICLVIFANTIGIMPYLIEDVIFYSLLLTFGITFTIVYVLRVEKVSFKEVGWEIKDVKKSILFGLIGYIPLVCFFPIIIILSNLQYWVVFTKK